MRSEKGFTLVEVIVAVALLAIIGIGLLSGLTGASTVLLKADTRETARDLAQAQMEYIQSQTYIASSEDYPTLPDIETKYPGYSVVTDFPMKSSIDEDGNLSDVDTGIQLITISVQKDEQTVFTLYGRKVMW